ncbi:MAG: DUF721 domain-containing protein [Deltaproteobacteria bacterium]|nr:MAG: DUF721 domain-containing protein [Deltaproteobacteria bacterium]
MADSSKKKIRTPEPLSGILKDALKTLGLHDRIEELSVLSLWERIVGPKIAQRAIPTSVFDHVLYVHVSDNVWMHQLYLHKQTILRKIEQTLGKGVIRDISFRIGTVEEPRLRERKRPHPPELDRIDLDPETLEEIERILAELEDVELRSVLRRIMIKDAKLKRYRLWKKDAEQT